MGDWTGDDEIKCSKCGHTWHDNCAFEYQVGTEVECPECRTVLACTDVELTRRWVWDQVREAKPDDTDEFKEAGILTDSAVADAHAEDEDGEG